jgi:anti-anti-sigma regulatory factor
VAGVRRVAPPLRIVVHRVGTTLDVKLPGSLLLSNRTALIGAVTANLAPDIRGVRLEASALREIDSAGLGALARVFRLVLDATGARPQLANAGPEIRASLRAVLLLRHFHLAADVEVHSPLSMTKPGLLRVLLSRFLQRRGWDVFPASTGQRRRAGI